jgi:hypothetical protein
MSEIFLKLRIKEMLEGKMKRYLIFGVVEVFLVVTGILIALSINNWDIKKSQRADELTIYKNIHNRIMDDREDVQGVIDHNDSHRTKFQFADQIISANDRSKIDTLIKIIPTLTEYSDFNKSSNIYQNLLNSGDVKLLKNKNVLTMLQNLEESYIYLNRMENIHLQVIMEVIAPVLLNTINFSSGEVERPDALYSLQFQNFFIVSIGIMEEKDEIYQRAVREIDAISLLIEEELKK